MAMIEKIREDVYRVRIPLPADLLPYTNAYVLKGADRSLIIDTGMNLPMCREAMQEALKELDIDIEGADIFVTHFHRDHTDLAPQIVTRNSRLFMGRVDFQEMEELTHHNKFLPDIPAFSRKSGFPEEDLREVYRFFKRHDVESPRPEGVSFALLEDGDILEIGESRLRCVMTPGHSKGHICLYDAEREILFAGDHILSGITPTIQGRFDDENPLKDYLASLEKVSGLAIELALPGHRSTITDSKGRIGELRDHHHQRAEEILSALVRGPANVYRVASLIGWNVQTGSWEGYDPLQRFMAVGETISHLNYLEKEGRIRKEIVEDEVLYG